uniref:Uncharacterized protein n=1 Tax=Anguilla anguilla TaxID=7936 RepID=A0A0E9X6G0_ANGAN
MLSPTVTTDTFIKPIRSLNLRQLCGVQAFFIYYELQKQSPHKVLRLVAFHSHIMGIGARTRR